MDIPLPPEDDELKRIIDKLAHFVARNGREFENLTKAKQQNNPKFHFLFGGVYFPYYQYRVATEAAMVTNDFGPPPGFYHGGPPPGGPPHHYGPPPDHGPPSHHGPPQPFPPPMNCPPFGQPHLAPHHHGEHPPPHFPNSRPHLSPFPPSMPSSNSLPPPMFQQQQQQQQSFPPQPHNLQPPTQQEPPPFNAWPFQQQQPHQHHTPPPHQHSTPPPIIPQAPPPQVDHVANNAQIAKARKEIAESEANLDAQHKVLMEDEKQTRIEEMITKAQSDELKRMCEDYSINLNEFDKILQPIIDTCRKESIANGKVWIFNHCTIPEHYEAVAKHLLKRVTQADTTFEGKLHLMYLINDLYNHCMRKSDELLKTAINTIIVPAFSTTLLEANDDKKQKMNKLLKLWETNQYLDTSLLDQLRSPEESLDAYKTSLYSRYAGQIKTITEEQAAKFTKMSKQHEEFVAHQQGVIQKLQAPPVQPPFHATNGQPPLLRPPFSQGPPNSNVYHHGPQGPQGLMPPRPPLPPQMFPGQAVPPQAGFPGPFPPLGPNGPPPGFYPNVNVPGTSGAPPFPSPLAPPSRYMPANTDPSNSPYQLGPIPLGEKPPESQRPYFDFPAGIMTSYVKLEDFEYNPINPKEMRIPALTPPTEKLIKALEAFYAPPTHENPRNAEGWEKLGLYEFLKIKSQARKEFEAKGGRIMADDKGGNENNSNGPSSRKANKSASKRSPSPPKRRFKEFKEEKDPKVVSSSNNSSSNKTPKSISMKSRSRSRSSSPPSKRRPKSKRTRSRSRSRSASPPRSSHRSTRPRHNRSRSPVGKQSRRRSRSSSPRPSFQPMSFTPRADPQVPLGESNMGRQMMLKMGWSGSGGLGRNESGIENPISGGEVREKVDQHRGVGAGLGASDPFESYRRNKSQTYIQRIRDARQ